MKTLPAVALCALAAASSFVAWRMIVVSPAAHGVVAPVPEQAPVPTPDGQPGRPDNHTTISTAKTEPGCTVVRRYLSSSGGVSVATVSCEPSARGTIHPYEHYPDGALESLAYADAHAAQVLGMRLIEKDPAASLSLIARSAALAGGDPAPIRRFYNAYPHPVSIDGIPQPDAVRVKFVLAEVAALLDGDASMADEWAVIIRAHSRDPDRELAQLQARAWAIVDAMRQIQLDVLGISTIGGQGDA